MDYGLVLFAAGLIENSLHHLRKKFRMPYRKYDKEGRPVGFDWGKVAVRFCFALGFGAALGAVIVTSWPDEPANLTWSDPCNDSVYKSVDVECKHPAHKLSLLGDKSVCSCQKDRQPEVIPNTASNDIEFMKGEISAIGYILEQNQKNLHHLMERCQNNSGEVPTIDLNQNKQCSGTSSGSCN